MTPEELAGRIRHLLANSSTSLNRAQLTSEQAHDLELAVVMLEDMSAKLKAANEPETIDPDNLPDTSAEQAEEEE